jgi:hypothetical protein
MMPDPLAPLYAEFLQAHPEHLAGTSIREVNGEPCLAMSRATLTRFITWSLAQGYADPAEAFTLLDALPVFEAQAALDARARRQHNDTPRGQNQ